MQVIPIIIGGGLNLRQVTFGEFIRSKLEIFIVVVATAGLKFTARSLTVHRLRR